MLKLYNTLTRKLEEFIPIEEGRVRFYHCGPTVYWVQHIGNLRAMVWSDLIRRTLIYLGYQVKFVRNYTDVGHLTSDADEGEDKITKSARKEGLSPRQIADKYIEIFEKDTKALNILEPDLKPRASDYIPAIIQFIQTLIDKGYAYITNQAVIFDVSKFPNYNRLNRQKLELNKPGAGRGTVDDPDKKHFADFNLWVFKRGVHKNALQTWPSPWGEGFPGWHIECSAMAKVLLGDTIDIHMGGIEHIAVHHTNEIAQSEAANGVEFVHYWLHNEHLLVDGKKMAKSEGTGLTLDQIHQNNLDPMALRYFFLTAHYRSPQNFTWKALKATQEAYQKLLSTIGELKKTEETTNALKQSKQIKNYQKQFKTLLEKDFQIPQAVALMWEVIKSELTPTTKLELLFDFDQVFGLKLTDYQENPIPDAIKKIADHRLVARQKKDYVTADLLRQQLEQAGYEIKDTVDSYILAPSKKNQTSPKK